ncbi:MAG: PIN domain nuclease [Chloroflexi bacterium]|nr:PIN domain nuclease [Chloroflexota bacterium]
MILVDTSVWIDFFRGVDSEHCNVLRDLIARESDLCLVDIILMEILQGVREDGRFEQLKSYLREFPVYSAGDISTFIRAAQIYRACRKKGKPVRRTVDCIIASIAIENGLELLHNDADFATIRDCCGLKTFGFEP